MGRGVIRGRRTKRGEEGCGQKSFCLLSSVDIRAQR